MGKEPGLCYLEGSALVSTMLIPPGFVRRSVVVSLGTISYVEADPDFWGSAAAKETTDLPSLVFIHGFGGGSSSYEWSKVYPAFVTDYRVLAPDLIGWGASDHPDRTYTTEDYLQMLWEFIEQMCPDPAVVVASSLTAAMMVRVAIDHPDHIRGLILVEPAGLADFGKDPSNSFINQLVKLPFVDKLIYGGAIATAEGIRLFLAQRQFADESKISNEIVEAYLKSAQQPNADIAALAFVRGDLSFDLAQYMPQLTTPTIILWGDKAQFVDIETGRRLAGLNPDTVISFETLPNVGLTPQLEQPSVTIGLIRTYLASTFPSQE
jgi:pimeloyl-ACP methyl ester carboxylesterase